MTDDLSLCVVGCAPVTCTGYCSLRTKVTNRHGASDLMGNRYSDSDMDMFT